MPGNELKMNRETVSGFILNSFCQFIFDFKSSFCEQTKHLSQPLNSKIKTHTTSNSSANWMHLGECLLRHISLSIWPLCPHCCSASSLPTGSTEQLSSLFTSASSIGSATFKSSLKFLENFICLIGVNAICIDLLRVSNESKIIFQSILNSFFSISKIFKMHYFFSEFQSHNMSRGFLIELYYATGRVSIGCSV